MNNNELICIMSPQLAKLLVNKGYIIKDLKPNKNDNKQVVFLFEKSEDIYKEIKQFRDK